MRDSATAQAPFEQGMQQQFYHGRVIRSIDYIQPKILPNAEGKSTLPTLSNKKFKTSASQEQK